MRVAISALSVKPNLTGGGETVLVNLLRALPAADPNIEYLLFITRANRGIFATVDTNVTRRTVSRWVVAPIFRVLYEIFVLPIVLRRWQADCFLAVNQVVSPLVSCPTLAVVQNLLYYRFRELYGKVSLGFQARCSLEFRNIYFSFLNGCSVRRAAHVIAVSETVKGEVVRRDGVGAEKVSVVPLAVSADFESPGRRDNRTDRVPVPRPFFLYVGAWEPYKNIDKAIAGLARLRSDYHRDDVQFVILGLNVHDYGKALHACAEAHDIGQAVHFVGPTPHRELGAWYRQAQALVLLSACEAFPLTPFEALANGTPVIGSNTGAVAEIIGESGQLVDPEDTEEIAAAMQRILVDGDFARAQIVRGYRQVSQFSWARTASEISDLLRTVVASAATPTAGSGSK